MNSWFSLCDKHGYPRSNRCLIVTATDDKYAPGVVGMIKSFLKNSELEPHFRVLVPDKKQLSSINLLKLLALPKTSVVDLSIREKNAPNHWCVWILETFFQDDLHHFDYVFYTDSDICVFESLIPFLEKFKSYEKDNVCVMEHKQWHKQWRALKGNDAKKFNAGFIIFKRAFFQSDLHMSIKRAIRKERPLNDETFLRSFLSNKLGRVLHAPTKYNARIIWLNKHKRGSYTTGDELVHVVHYVGQENKPWLSHRLRSKATHWYDRWNECNDWEVE